MIRTAKGRMTLAEERPSPRRRRRAAWIFVVVVLAVIAAGGLALRHTIQGFTTPTCRGYAMKTEITFSPEQTSNAATIAAIALRRGLPARAATIGIATAIQESKLRNITYGDRDSLGLFQQRPSQGWGTAAQVTDPEYATNAFFDALVKVDGWQTMEITKIAQTVQKSAAPAAYADHETEGRVLASALSGHAPGDFGCRIDPPTKVADETALQKQMQDQLGYAGTRKGSTLVVKASDVQHAWAVGSWAVAKADGIGIRSVVVGDRRWVASRDASAWSWQPAGSAASGSPSTVVIHLR
jgi:hypothetical protein